MAWSCGLVLHVARSSAARSVVCGLLLHLAWSCGLVLVCRTFSLLLHVAWSCGLVLHMAWSFGPSVICGLLLLHVACLSAQSFFFNLNFLKKIFTLYKP